MITNTEQDVYTPVDVGIKDPAPVAGCGFPIDLSDSRQHSGLPPRTPRTHQRELPSVLRADTFISVDVFDTLLYRKPISERRRFFLAASAFVRMHPHIPMPTILSVCAARTEATRWAYHSIDLLHHDSEVKLSDVFLHQLQLLGLSAEFLPALMTAEIETEKNVLTPNRRLIKWMSFQRSKNIRVVAISDTSMSSASLQAVIDAVAGYNVIDHLYTSADIGLSKRNGGIFAAVCLLENKSPAQQLHLGDDETADIVRSRAAGVDAIHLPRSRSFVLKRKIDGALFQLASVAKRSQRSKKAHSATIFRFADARSFGQHVLGPVFALYCTRLWLYLSFAGQSEGGAIALFCARGGMQLRSMFEEFLSKTGLPLQTPRADLMVSRLVALRAALLAGAPSAYDEIGREFAGYSMAKIARAIAQADIEFGPEWHAPYDPPSFAGLIFSTAVGAQLRSRLMEQNNLFTLHLESLASDNDRLILCDTGLYGSTLRMLHEGFPARHWECLLFARSNYKKFSSDHFARTRGVISESNSYDPTDGASAVLRYWQLIEHIFEPDLPSVSTFARTGPATVTSNLETSGWREHMDATRPPLLQGIIDYLAGMSAEGWFQQIRNDVPHSWRVLKKSIVYPDANDLQWLYTGPRSHDFGKDEKYMTIPATRRRTPLLKLREFRETGWKGGYIAQECGILRKLFQTAIESLYVLRWLASRPS